MTLSRFEKFVLGLAGTTAAAISGVILAAPHTFYASYGIYLGDDPSLLSELRAPAAGLLTLGLLMFAGIFRQNWVSVSIVAALTVFIGFPAGRLIGLAVDGMPSNGIIVALIIELIIAGLCLMAFRRRFRRNASVQSLSLTQSISS